MEKRDHTLQDSIREDLKSKIVLLSGPRQVGKTTFCRNLYRDFEYLNFDDWEDRKIILERSWKRSKDLVIFDELHKLPNWKGFLKGIYDNTREKYPVLVTGSSRLEIAKKVGDSLAGRFFGYRLHPMDVKEMSNLGKPEDLMNQLMRVGGFPEPFLNGSEKFYRRWKRSHIDIILRQDLIDLENVRDIVKIEILIELLRNRVGSPVSYTSLARDLEKDPTTVKRWLEILENLFIIFKVTPYHENIARAILKEPKYYFYNIPLAGEGPSRFENLIACAIHKELHRIEDLEGYSTSLRYLRTKDGKELDFLVIVDNKPKCILEVKTSDNSPSSNFQAFENYFPGVPRIQLVKELTREKEYDWGLSIRQAAIWLSQISFL